MMCVDFEFGQKVYIKPSRLKGFLYITLNHCINDRNLRFRNAIKAPSFCRDRLL